MEELPLFKSEYRIVKFDGKDIPKEEDLKNLKTMIESSEDLYPGIDLWYKRKVVEGLGTGERFAILIYHDDDPVGSAILRKGEEAKLCSMRIDPSHQYRGLGGLILALMTVEVRHMAKNIHFTIPDNLWAEFKDFFSNYGFDNVGQADKQYRLFSEEIACGAPFIDVWSHVRDTLPKIMREFKFAGEANIPDLLFSLHPEYAEQIINGKKFVEVRKGFPPRWSGATMWLYATLPQQEIVGQAKIDDVDVDTPSNIWERYRERLGCNYEEFQSYCGDYLKISAIQLSEVKGYERRLPLGQLESLVGEPLRPPQSYQIIRNSPLWNKALALSSVLRSGSYYSVQY